MAEVTSPGRLRNRRAALDAALAKATTPRQVLAAAADYYRAMYAHADKEVAYLAARKLIEMADKRFAEMAEQEGREL